MAQFSMADYFTGSLAADYATTPLSLPPHDKLIVEPVKTQQLLFTDDNSPLPISIDDTVAFRISVTWINLEQSEGGTVMDYWLNASKGNGIMRTFYWTHPVDAETYTVRFIQKPTHISHNYPNESIDNVKFLVEGVMP